MSEFVLPLYDKCNYYTENLDINIKKFLESYKKANKTSNTSGKNTSTINKNKKKNFINMTKNYSIKDIIEEIVKVLAELKKDIRECLHNFKILCNVIDNTTIYDKITKIWQKITSIDGDGVEIIDLHKILLYKGGKKGITITTNDEKTRHEIMEVLYKVAYRYDDVLAENINDIEMLRIINDGELIYQHKKIKFLEATKTHSIKDIIKKIHTLYKKLYVSEEHQQEWDFKKTVE